MAQNVLVLFGGCSSEYEVSLQSAAAVIRAVDTARYQLLTVGITRMGQWLYYSGPVEEIEKGSWCAHPSCVPALLSPSREDHGLWLMHPEGCQLKTVDLCLPVLHGKNGEDGTVQGLLELAGIPIAGCGCRTSALCMDKELAHKLAAAAGIACPRFVTLHGQGVPVTKLAQQVHAGMQGIPYPWFVKPAKEGSSFGVSRVATEEELPAALQAALRYGEKIVVEEGISGFEVGCAVLGGSQPLVGAIDAIRLSGGFFDYHEKYTLQTAEILLPAPVNAAAAEKIRQTALKLYQLFECSGFARVDLFYTEQGEVVFNEINTIPGMTAHSRYPGMLGAAGIPFDEMVSRMLQQAVCL